MEIFKIWDKEFPLYDESITNEQNDGINTIEFYPVETEKDLPLVIIFPGGGYTFRSNINEGAYVAEFFNSKGMHAAVVQYRVAPYCYPAPLLDAQRAIKLLRFKAKELKINAERVFTLGFSAGGHLTGMTATFPDVCNIYNDEVDKMSHKPSGAILCYPVISTDTDKIHEGSFKCLLGENFEKREEYSIEKRVDDETCPCFVFHCTYDGLVPRGNSIALASALWERKIRCELHIFQEGGHGGGLRQVNAHSRIWPTLAFDWMERIDKEDM